MECGDGAAAAEAVAAVACGSFYVGSFRIFREPYCLPRDGAVCAEHHAQAAAGTIAVSVGGGDGIEYWQRGEYHGESAELGDFAGGAWFPNFVQRSRNVLAETTIRVRNLSDESTDEIWSLLQAAGDSGVDPAIVYAMKKTGRIVTETNVHFLTGAELQEWNDAVDEYHQKVEAGETQ